MICRGGLATLWLATDKLGRNFALRIMHDDFRSGSSGPKMFRRGCEVMAKLPRHPNLVGYLDHGRKKGHDYMLMEYVEGANLREMAIRQDPIIGQYLAEFILHMAAAMNHVQNHGYMHLDLKPENLVISRGGTLLLCDFDTTIPIPDEPKRLGKAAGTPLYMPPEQLNGQIVDNRADIYSYGVTAYEMLTQIKPFEGESQKEMLENQMNPKYRIRPIRQFNPTIPALLEKAIHKCMAYLPERRYFSFPHLIRDLNKSLGVRAV